MKTKLPAQAFEHYVSLGVDRSYAATAAHYGVTKVTVANRAKTENWQQRLRELERKAMQRSEEKAIESLEAVRARQLKAARYLQSRAIAALRDLPPEQAMKAGTALAIGWKHELLLLGEPCERTELDVAQVVERESRRWLKGAAGMPRDDEDTRKT